MTGALPLLLNYAAAFIAVFILCQAVGGVVLERRRSADALQRRVAALAAPREALAVSAPLVRLAEQTAATDFDPWSTLKVKKLHKQSGLRWPLWQVAGLAITAAIALVALTAWLIFVPIIQLPAIALTSFGLFFWLLRRARARRCDLFIEQLPDALDVAIRSLQAGHPFMSSLAMVADELPDPVATEFRTLAEQLSYGTSMDDALNAMQERMPADDLHYLTMALSIHDKSGGNLTHTLRTLSDLIRSRYQLRGKIRALSSESRFTAKLMSVFPIIIYFVVDLITPGYFDTLWESSIRDYVVGFCIIMTLMGNFFIRRMIRIEV